MTMCQTIVKQGSSVEDKKYKYLVNILVLFSSQFILTIVFLKMMAVLVIMCASCYVRNIATIS